MKSARLIARVFCLILFSALVTVLLGAQTPGSLKRHASASIDLTPFTALITKTEAQFVLPVPIRPEWKWRRPETEDNAQEYRMSVAVENDGGKYSFGFYLWKRAGAQSQSGTLAELIKAGQTSVFGRTAAGMNTIIREAGIKSKLDKNTLIITVRGQKNVERLFSGRPAEVTFDIRVPDEVPIARTVAVAYQD